MGSSEKFTTLKNILTKMNKNHETWEITISFNHPA